MAARVPLFRSLDFIYVPTDDVDATARAYAEQLDAEMVWKVRGISTVVACLRISDDAPPILLSGHLEGPVPILIYRVDDHDATVAALCRAGIAVRELEIPHGPCAAFTAPGGQRLAIYQLTRPGADAHFAGRFDE